MMHPSTPGRVFKRAGRFQHILNVFAKQGFNEILTQIRAWEGRTIDKRLLRKEVKAGSELTAAERLRMAFEELGPTFIKLGQVLSTRPDLVPQEIIEEMKKLQSSVHSVPTNVIREVIEAELGKPIEEIFDSFEDIPLSAASLAQVHRGVLNGEQVVLKVQRPHITEITEEDIGIMRYIASLAERYSPSAYLVNPIGLVDEFADQIRKELDFRAEANNMHRFSHNFANDKTVYIPAVYFDLCTKRVLTMEFLNGIKISDVTKLAAMDYDLPLIARRGAIIGFKATFKHGFFHADPHPGNIIILPGNIIGLVDFGMMAILSTRDRERLAKLVSFISIRDEKRVARALNQLSESEDVIPSEDLEPAMMAVIQEYGDVPVSEFRLGAMLFALTRAILQHGARLRPQLIWLTKSLATQEDIAHSLQADFNFIDLGRSYARSTLTRAINPLHQPRELYFWFMDVLDMVRDLPYNASVIVRELRKGKIRIEFEHVGLEPIRQSMNRSTNRLSLTVLTAALLISAAVVTLARVPPLVGNVALIALILYIFAGVIGAVLIFNILFRSR